MRERVEAPHSETARTSSLFRRRHSARSKNWRTLCSARRPNTLKSRVQ